MLSTERKLRKGKDDREVVLFFAPGLLTLYLFYKNPSKINTSYTENSPIYTLYLFYTLYHFYSLYLFYPKSHKNKYNLPLLACIFFVQNVRKLIQAILRTVLFTPCIFFAQNARKLIQAIQGRSRSLEAAYKKSFVALTFKNE